MQEKAAAPTSSAWTLALLEEMLRHMEWADATVWRALLAHPPAAHDRRLRDVLLHMNGVQRAFLALWTSGPLPVRPEEGTYDFADIYGWFPGYYADLARALRTFDPAMLTRPIRVPGLERYEQQMGRRFENPSLAETMLQVAVHTTYHRGQVNARLREIGGEPPLVDWIAWIWFGRPAAEWPDAGRKTVGAAGN